LFGLPISTGKIAKLGRSTADALAQPMAESEERVRTQPANVDETSWREAGPRAWLWGVVTPNAAERALRHAVLWRKGRGGTDGSRGSRFVERVLSVRETCRPQGRGLLGYLVACCQARLRGEEAPSLLPTKASRLEIA